MYCYCTCSRYFCIGTVRINDTFILVCNYFVLVHGHWNNMLITIYHLLYHVICNETVILAGDIFCLGAWYFLCYKLCILEVTYKEAILIIWSNLRMRNRKSPQFRKGHEVDRNVQSPRIGRWRNATWHLRPLQSFCYL